VKRAQKATTEAIRGRRWLFGASFALTFAAVTTVAAPAASAPIKTVLQPSDTNPLVAIRLYFKVGAADDPKGKEGLAALTAAMLGKGGTTKRSYSDVLDALYPLAARIGYYGDKESFVFTGTVHRDNLAAYAELLADQVLTPAFTEEDFTRNRQDAVDGITKTLRGNDDESLGKAALGLLLFNNHPYGHPTLGTVAGLTSLTVDDVKAFYAQHFTRDRLIIGVGGGFPAEFAQSFAAKFDALPAKGKPPVRLPPPNTRRNAEILLVQKAAPATAISIGHPIRITRADADFYPLTVARSYLGEHRTFNGVLMNRMRGVRGLNYGDYAYIENFIQEGGSTFPLPNIPRRQQHFEIWIRPVQPPNTLFALRQAIYETDKLWREGIPEKGFEETRQFLLTYSNLWAQDASRRLGFAIDAEIYGRDLVKELQRRLPTMKKAEVDRAIKRHLTPKRWAAAIVTADAQGVQEQLLSGAPTPIVYDTKGTPDDILEEDKTIEKFPLPIKPADVSIVPVEQLFER
jgi:zinc protease